MDARGTGTLTLTLGTTGRPAFGEPVQDGVHRLLGNTRQLGWSHQLAARPVVQVRGEAVRWRERAVGGQGIAAVRARLPTDAGSAWTLGAASVDMVVGRRAALPWNAAEPEVARPARLYASLGVRQDAVLRDVRVQGWPGTAGAERRAWVRRAKRPSGSGGAPAPCSTATSCAAASTPPSATHTRTARWRSRCNGTEPACA